MVAGLATGLGLFPALLIRLPVIGGEVGTVVLALVLSVVAGGLAALGALLAPRLAGLARRFAVEHRRAVRLAARVAVGAAVLLAAAGLVVLGWFGQPVAAVALVVVKEVWAYCSSAA